MLYVLYILYIYVLNSSLNVLLETEINVLEKCLCFLHTPNFINKAHLQRGFQDFSRKIRCK